MSRPPPIPKPSRGRIKLGGLLTTSGKLFRSAVPIPGLDELSATAKLLLRNIQSTPDASSELRALGQKLQCVSVILEKLILLDLENVEYYKSQFEDIGRIITETLSCSGTISRFHKAKDHLDVYEDLDRRLSSIIEMARLDIKCQNALSREEDKLAETIHPQRITDLTDYPVSYEPRHLGRLLDGPRTPSETSPVICTRRRGKFGTLSVHYATYTSSSPGRARKARTEVLVKLSQLSHNHIAPVLGKTSGCGISGIVFAAGSKPIEDYLKHGGLREAAKCVLEFYSAYHYLFKNTSFTLKVERIEISNSGSLLVIPRASNGGGGEATLSNVMSRLDGRIDPALQLFIPYFTKLLIFSLFNDLRESQEKFLGTLATERKYWNELQALKLTKDLNLPTPDHHSASWRSNRPPSFNIQAGNMFSVTRFQAGRAVMHWIDSADSYLTSIQKEPNSSQGWVIPGSSHNELSKDGWISHALDPNPHLLTYYYYATEETLDEAWPSFMQAAKERAHPKAHLYNICLCTYASMHIEISQIELAETETLYFHRSESPSAHPADFWGHFSTSSSVIPGVTQQEAKQRGWEVTYEMRLGFHGTNGDWGYRYELALQNTMNTTPGIFKPEAACTDAPEDSEILQGVQGADWPETVTGVGRWYDRSCLGVSRLSLYLGNLKP